MVLVILGSLNIRVLSITNRLSISSPIFIVSNIKSILANGNGGMTFATFDKWEKCDYTDTISSTYKAERDRPAH